MGCLTWSYASLGFPGSLAANESACSGGDLASIPGLGRSPGEGKGYPLQYSFLENSMDCRVHEVAKTHTRLSDFHFVFPYYCILRVVSILGITSPLLTNCFQILIVTPGLWLFFAFLFTVSFKKLIFFWYISIFLFFSSSFCVCSKKNYLLSVCLVAQLSPALCDPMTRQGPLSMQEYQSGQPFPSSEDLLNPGIKPGLLHCRRILYCLSHHGSPLLSTRLGNFLLNFFLRSLLLKLPF